MEMEETRLLSVTSKMHMKIFVRIVMGALNTIVNTSYFISACGKYVINFVICAITNVTCMQQRHYGTYLYRETNY